MQQESIQFPRIEAGPIQTIAKPKINGGFDTALFPIRGESKFAYWATARTLGDTFVRSAPVWLACGGGSFKFLLKRRYGVFKFLSRYSSFYSDVTMAAS
jgi:hypothetical protein